MVHLCSGISDTEWSENHHEELKHFETGGAHSKSKYVFVAFDEMIVWQTINVTRIIKVSIAFSGDQTRIVSPPAFEAAAASARDVSAPVCSLQGRGIELVLDQAAAHYRTGSAFPTAHTVIWSCDPAGADTPRDWILIVVWPLGRVAG